MGKRKRPKPSRPGFTPLGSLKKEGSRLRGPLAALTGKFEQVDWARDLLPEHLWLAGVADQVGLDRAAPVYNAFMDALDAHWSYDFVALGLVSDFGLIEDAKRIPFAEENRELIDECFHKPLGRILSLYPDCPATWLINRKRLESEGHVEPFAELARLRRLVTMLMPGKEKFAARIRAIPLNRLFKHNKLFLAKGLHDIRHTCITKLSEGQASDMTILSVAGHVSRRMLERYSHIRMEAKRAALDAIVLRPERAVFGEAVHQNVHQLQDGVLDASSKSLN